MDRTMLNHSGAWDPTPHAAINNVMREKKNAENRDRDAAAETLVKTIKNIAFLSGFKLVGRIQFEDPKTGRKYL